MPVLPTPYDITPLPYFPYAPGAREWLYFLVLAGCVLLLALWVARRIRRQSSIEAFGFALSELMSLNGSTESTLNKNQLARISLIVKRLVSSLTGYPVAQYSSKELQQFINGPVSTVTRELMMRIQEIDTFKYQPDDAPLPPAATLGSFIALVERLEQESGGKT